MLCKRFKDWDSCSNKPWDLRKSLHWSLRFLLLWMNMWDPWHDILQLHVLLDLKGSHGVSFKCQLSQKVFFFFLFFFLDKRMHVWQWAETNIFKNLGRIREVILKDQKNRDLDYRKVPVRLKVSKCCTGSWLRWWHIELDLDLSVYLFIKMRATISGQWNFPHKAIILKGNDTPPR